MRIPIRWKLTAGFVGVLAMLGATGYLGVSELGKANERSETFASEPFVQTQRLGEFLSRKQSAQLSLQGLISSNDPAESQQLRGRLESDLAGMDTAFAAYSTALSAERRQATADIASLTADMRAAMEKVIPLALTTFSSDALVAMNKAEPLGTEIGNQLQQMQATLRNAPQTPIITIASNTVADMRTRFPEVRLVANRLLLETDDAKLDAMGKLVKSRQAQFGALIGQLQSSAGAEIPGKIEKLIRDWDRFKTAMDLWVNGALSNDNGRASALLESDVNPVAAQLETRIHEQMTEESAAAQAITAQTKAAYRETRAILTGLVVGAILLGLGIAFWLGRSINRGLRLVGENVARIGSGDLSHRILHSRQDEIGDLLTQLCRMRLHLNEIIADVRTSSGQVASGSAQSASTAEQLSSGSTEQAAASEQASAAIEEMTANVRQNADNASATEKMALAASQSAEQSGEAVTRSVVAMREIADRIRVVQEIARQTDLLALNAAF